jgi:hypothetical protein
MNEQQSLHEIFVTVLLRYSLQNNKKNVLMWSVGHAVA